MASSKKRPDADAAGHMWAQAERPLATEVLQVAENKR
jgi:hypothetical protein